MYELADGSSEGKRAYVKVSAGFLIEQAGLKGQMRGNVGVYEKHALVIVRHRAGPGSDILDLAEEVQRVVLEKFGVRLEVEPVVWRGPGEAY